MRLLALVLLPLSCLACSEGEADQILPPAPPDTSAVKVLFVGNSLTAANDLPALVAGLAEASGATRRLEVHSVVFDGFSLEDHLTEGSAAAEIAAGDWDVVVLQQGPSSLDASREQLRRDTRVFAGLATAIGARTALYGVWPAEANLGGLDRVIESYRLAAVDVGGIYFPAGGAWRAAWRRDASFDPHIDDRFHPNIRGTYLAALVIFARLFDHAPLGLPGRFRYGFRRELAVAFEPDEALFLQHAASDALAEVAAP
jgi:hypothetical protein